ncbi:MAG TPA: hypothetical protein VGF24_32125 [Vicinamibacterales bacterium]
MKSGRVILIAAPMFSLAAATPMAGGRDMVVEFGEPQPQAIPNGLASHVLVPDEAFVREGGTVTFNVNGGGHGIAIYPVSNNTTREDISGDLCQGGPALCNGAAGTANLAYQIIDGRQHLIIETDTAANQPRIDDPLHRYLSTSGTNPNEQTVTAGAFLAGSTSITVPGNRIQVRFTKAGRYLVVCQNRGHLLNDWMFGFVNVVVNDDNDPQ